MLFQFLSYLFATDDDDLQRIKSFQAKEGEHL